jgi:hypothetical protein
VVASRVGALGCRGRRERGSLSLARRAARPRCSGASAASLVLGLGQPPSFRSGCARRRPDMNGASHEGQHLPRQVEPLTERSQIQVLSRYQQNPLPSKGSLH